MENLRPKLKSLCVVLLFFSSQVSYLYAQPPTPQAKSEKSIEDLQVQLDDVEKRLTALASAEMQSVVPRPSAVPSQAELLRRYQTILRRHIAQKEKMLRLKDSLERVSREIELFNQEGLREEAPYSIALLDDLQTQLEIAEEKTERSEQALQAAKARKTIVNDQLEDLSALRRRLLEKSGSEAAETLDTELAVEVAEADLDLARAEIASAELAKNLALKEQSLLLTKLSLVKQAFRFDEAAFQTILSKLEEERNVLEEQVRDNQRAYDLSNERLLSLFRDDVDDKLQETEIEARESWLSNHQRKKEFLAKRLEWNLLRQDLWRQRYLLYNGELKGLGEWIENLKGLLSQLRQEQELLRSELDQIRTEIGALLEGDTTEEWFEVRFQALSNRREAAEKTLSDLLKTESLAKRTLGDILAKKRTLPAKELFPSIWSKLLKFWNTELYVVDEKGVTVGKLATVVILLILGLSFVGRLTSFLCTRIFSSLPIPLNAKINLERILKYFFGFLIFLFSLHVVNIPLTVFTFLGGSLAIAVGFGASTISNNFISGLILMAEKPIKLGDFVEVDGTIGKVEDIGARATRIKIPSGIHVVLPNSTFLENKVVNWTLEDRYLRTSVTVGVSYGSPTRVVEELIVSACAREPRVSVSPEPIAVFDEFADSSLNFTAHFWVLMEESLLERDRIRASVRHHIAEIFQENQISIPFPQRDLHFPGPVEVKLRNSTS